MGRELESGDVMVNFMCQLDWAKVAGKTLPRWLVKHF